jgi:hypothetical protein
MTLQVSDPNPILAGWRDREVDGRLFGDARRSVRNATTGRIIDVQGVSGRCEQGKLVRLQVRIDNNTPWLTLIRP